MPHQRTPPKGTGESGGRPSVAVRWRRTLSATGALAKCSTAASSSAFIGPPNRMDISINQGSHPSTRPRPRPNNRRHRAPRNTTTYRPIAPASTVASVGRTNAIAASTAEASTACHLSPPSRRRATNPAVASPRIAAQRFGITSDPLQRPSHEKENSAAATGAARPTNGIHNLNVAVIVTAEASIRKSRRLRPIRPATSREPPGEGYLWRATPRRPSDRSPA